MSTIIMSKPASKLEPSLKKKAYAFLEKLGEDDTSPGLHIEPIANSADDKVRTGRVDQFYRAVLFRVPSKGEPMYVFHGIWPHDDAIAVAKKTRLTVNPVNGVTEITTVAETPAPVSPITQAPPARAAQPVSASPAPVPLLVSLGLDGKALVDVLGIDESLAVRALAAVDENALMALAESAVEWQGLALIDLATGLSVTDIQDKLSLSEPPATGPRPMRTGWWKGCAIPPRRCRSPGSRTTRSSAGSSKAVTSVRGACFSTRSSASTPGAPTRGRSACPGARAPARPWCCCTGPGCWPVVSPARGSCSPPSPPTSPTSCAPTSIASTRPCPRRPASVSLASPCTGSTRWRARSCGGRGRTSPKTRKPSSGWPRTQIGGRTPGTGWRDALDAAGGGLPAALRSTQFLADEYAQVVLANRITSRETYYKVRRPGRGVALDRAKRAAVWDVIEAYRAQARIAGSVDFPEAATIAAVHLRRVAEVGAQYVADHVLVDEGQDLGPAHWQLLRALAGEHADDLFIAEDSYQRIYGRRVVLSAFGIRIVGRSQRLTLNYRTTAQNLAYAINVLEGGAYVDLESDQESTARYRSARSGPVPRLIACATLTEELDRAADLIRTWVAETGAPETIAVLVREQRQRDRLVSGLAERGVTIRAVDREHVKPGQPVAMTMHRAKGTEFSKVLLFGIDQGAIPRPLRDEQYAEDAWADALLRERSLLYVAATRARDELALSWNGDPSQLLPRAKPD